MKKSLFGYNVSEVNVMINALREENESLNTTITTLKTQMKNGVNGNGARFSLLETDLKKYEEELKRVSEEKSELILRISSLTKEVEDLRLQNTELMAQPKALHMQNILETQLAAGKEAQANTVPDKKMIEEAHTSAEELSALRGEPYESTYLPALNTVKQVDEPYQTALVDIEQLKDELKHAKQELENTSTVLDRKNEELINTKKELSSTKDALITTKAAFESAIDQLEKYQKEKQPININKASEISYQAYYEMSRMRNEMVEFMHQLTKEYYQLINDNNLKIRTAIEYRQQEYNQMVREFFTNASEFRNKLSGIEIECSNVVDFNMNIEQVSMRMKEIMDQFMNECEVSIRNT